MISDALAIVLYTSTKGHFGYKDCYKHTVERMIEEIPFFADYEKVAHIKYSLEDGEKQLIEMKDFLEKRGFEVLISQGDWSHNKGSHAKEYYKDMFTALSSEKIRKRRFTLVCEDDWLLDFKGKWPVAVSKALQFLDKDKDRLCVRVNHDIHKDLSKADEVVDGLIHQQNTDYTPWGPTFTFQPTIVKSSEWFNSVRFINRNLDALEKVHCEIISGEILSMFSDSRTPFCFFNPEKVNAEHIGEIEKVKNYESLDNPAAL